MRRCVVGLCCALAMIGLVLVPTHTASAGSSQLCAWPTRSGLTVAGTCIHWVSASNGYALSGWHVWNATGGATTGNVYAVVRWGFASKYTGGIRDRATYSYGTPGTVLPWGSYVRFQVAYAGWGPVCAYVRPGSRAVHGGTCP